MRFNGRFGFPNGIVEDTTLEDVLFCELIEEMCNLPQNFKINMNDNVMPHLVEWKLSLLYFYAKDVPFNQYLEIEKMSIMVLRYFIYRCLLFSGLP